ncbi:hypothetical protein AV530_006138 [Patagioenas fasciata monilis]|uniref:Uncharacterized protein n=1 Tax=Patagioenas fasciata monilis TaxID=372326 RepID=A0A1V4J8B1_PATFA|nr:hypothetical protein AV530_006138 [Patagioenas fasciata monilis]
MKLVTDKTYVSSSAAVWCSSHEIQSFMNCCNMGPSHRLQFFNNCSNVSPFHVVQISRNRLLQGGSTMGHSSCQKPASAWSIHGPQLPSGFATVCSVDIWSGVIPA